ncbi:YkgJ family cysteine cluster protein [Natronorubrum halophilum]|uniref:YkgJ family cysteine cluster protein n=1 Tax=Natronorubrum halophilum TaxID=1702106 RepID=UPI000EF67080|nr:YkgJ family cysteine cluster protein [Natronorubrum halophilum]
MEVNCRGCAGCCLDWRPLLENDADRSTHRQRRAPFNDESETERTPLDEDTSFVALTRDEVRAFLEAGMAPALTPRFWRARDADEGVEIDGHSVAAVAGRPVFFVGLRKPPKPVAPFDREEPAWLPTCVFLDPATLQCRIHDDELFPGECGAYPKHNIALEQETECERVESNFGGERLLEAGIEDDAGDLDGLLLGSQALGAKLFAHPRPDALEGIVERTAAGELTAADRAECLAVAAASSPGTLATSDHHYERGKERALETATDGHGAAAERDGSWVGPAIREWYRRKRNAGETVPSSDTATAVEEARGAPETPGWDALE